MGRVVNKCKLIILIIYHGKAGPKLLPPFLTAASICLILYFNCCSILSWNLFPNWWWSSAANMVQGLQQFQRRFHGSCGTFLFNTDCSRVTSQNSSSWDIKFHSFQPFLGLEVLIQTVTVLWYASRTKNASVYVATACPHLLCMEWLLCFWWLSRMKCRLYKCAAVPGNSMQYPTE